VRPTEEREIVRRKVFVFGAMSVAEAADVLQDLDHDFLLFRDAGTNADAAVYWREDGLLEVIEPRSVELTDEPGRFVSRADSLHR